MRQEPIRKERKERGRGRGREGGREGGRWYRDRNSSGVLKVMCSAMAGRVWEWEPVLLATLHTVQESLHI